jgi:predicted TIM-barrel fold metal-dependent hydrolase
MFIIDAQVHVWLPDRADRPWPKDNHAAPHLPEALTYERMLALMQEAGVDRAILVPPSWDGNRTDHALEAARKYPDRFGVVARVPLDDKNCPEIVAGWKQQPGMLGIRMVFVRPSEQAALKNGSVDWFWKAAESANIPVMVHVPQSSTELAAIAQRHPQLKLIVDHMGLYKLTTRDAGFTQAIDRTVELSRFPNVHVKLSSIPYYSVEPYPFSDMYPHVRRLIEAYGPKRSFWGTDISKLLPRHSYRTCVDHMLQMDFLSNEDKEWIMGRALAQCMGWPIPARE